MIKRKKCLLKYHLKKEQLGFGSNILLIKLNILLSLKIKEIIIKDFLNEYIIFKMISKKESNYKKILS